MDQTRLDHLIEKYADGTATPEELQELLEWYRSADIEAVEWPASRPDEKEQLQQRMLLRLQQQMHRNGELKIPRNGERTRVLHMRGWRVAASLIIIASVTWIARQYLDLTGKNVNIEVNNPSGKIQAILLPDSSRVWLNAASSIHYAKPFGSRRDIFLEGEAYFEVTNKPDHPFVVHAGALTTTVLGTSFDVKAFAAEQETSITVIRGKVRVQDSSSTQHSSSTQANSSIQDNASTLDILTPARQLQIDRKTRQFRTVMVDTNQVIGWRQGRLQFSGQSMEEIAASLGRWYNVRFIFSNPGISRCRYYLNFDNSISLHDLLIVLGEATGMTFRQDDVNHSVTLSGDACR